MKITCKIIKASRRTELKVLIGLLQWEFSTWVDNTKYNEKFDYYYETWVDYV